MKITKIDQQEQVTPRLLPVINMLEGLALPSCDGKEERHAEVLWVTPNNEQDPVATVRIAEAE